MAVLRSGREVLMTADDADPLVAADFVASKLPDGFVPVVSGAIKGAEIERIRVVRTAWWLRLRAFLRSLWTRFDDWYERSVMDYMASRRILDDAWLVTEPATGEVLEIEEVEDGT
jgi:hypothetical protein